MGRVECSFFSVSFEDAKEVPFEEILFSSSFVDTREIFFSVSFEDAKEIAFEDAKESPSSP